MATSQSQETPIDESAAAALWDQLRRSSKPLVTRDHNRNNDNNPEMLSCNHGSQSQQEFDENTAMLLSNSSKNQPLHTGPSLNTQESHFRNVYPAGDNLNNNKLSSATASPSQGLSSETYRHTQESKSKKKKKKRKDKERKKSNKRSKEDIVMYDMTQELSPTGKTTASTVNDNKSSIWNMSEDSTLLQMIEDDFEQQKQETMSNSNQTRDHVNESDSPYRRNDGDSDRDIQGSGSLFELNTNKWDGLDFDDDGLT